MVKVKCSVPNYDFVTEDGSEALVIAILTNHGLARPPRPKTRATTSGHRCNNRRMECIRAPLERFPKWIRDQ